MAAAAAAATATATATRTGGRPLPPPPHAKAATSFVAVHRSGARESIIGHRASSRPAKAEPQPAAAAAAAVEQACCRQTTCALLAALPVQAADFQSGRKHVSGGDPRRVRVTFPRQFRRAPRVQVWFLLRAGVRAAAASALGEVTVQGFTVVVEGEGAEQISGFPLQWIAYDDQRGNIEATPAVERVVACPSSLNSIALTELDKIIKEAGINAVSSEGRTLLHTAALAGNNELTTWLLERDASPDVQDKKGWTPLMCAASLGHVEIMKSLLRTGANTSLQNLDGRTALHIAVSARSLQNRTDVVQALLAEFVDVNVTTKMNATPLLNACSDNDEKLVSLLLKHNASVSIANDVGQTPLCFAVEHKNLAMIEALLKHGANPKQGPPAKSPLDIARSAGNSVLAELFTTAAATTPVPTTHTPVVRPRTSTPPATKTASPSPASVASLPLTVHVAVASSTSAETALAAARQSARVASTPVESLPRRPNETFEAALRRPEARQLHTHMRRFLKGFGGVKFPTLEEEGDAVKCFIRKVEVSMGQCPAWERLPTDQFDEHCAQMRAYVFIKLYSTVFEKQELLDRDLMLVRKIRLVEHLVTPEFLELPEPETMDEELIVSAKQNLLELDSLFSPDDKLVCICDAVHILNTVLKKSGLEGTAEELVAILVLVLVQTNMPHLLSNLSYIERFSEMDGSEIFCTFTNFHVAATYIEELPLQTILAAQKRRSHNGIIK
eukprot:TRINITY_DN1928_c0_g1_i1.p1 TRINITY_DN1928_c0_g1~~TRINITY_DN1928_c0_g1_i1.p1  ORF type:complete len:795 (-),score=194.77 TRINITY_DN1928_c0_g1_i1:42-2225(-)